MNRNYNPAGRQAGFYNKAGAYFVSFATVYWIAIFTRQAYFGVLEELQYYRKEKGMEVYAYCFMPGHVHFIFRSAGEDPSGFLG